MRASPQRVCPLQHRANMYVFFTTPGSARGPIGCPPEDPVPMKASASQSEIDTVRIKEEFSNNSLLLLIRSRAETHNQVD